MRQLADGYSELSAVLTLATSVDVTQSPVLTPTRTYYSAACADFMGTIGPRHYFRWQFSPRPLAKFMGERLHLPRRNRGR